MGSMRNRAVVSQLKHPSKSSEEMSKVAVQGITEQVVVKTEAGEDVPL